MTEVKQCKYTVTWTDGETKVLPMLPHQAENLRQVDCVESVKLVSKGAKQN